MEKGFSKNIRENVREYQSSREQKTGENLSKELIDSKSESIIDWLSAGGSIGEYLKGNQEMESSRSDAEDETDDDLSEALSEDEKKLLNLKEENMKQIGKDYRSVMFERRKLDEFEKHLLENFWDIRQRGKDSQEISRALQEIQKRKRQNEERLEENMQSNPEAWYAHHLLELRGYKRALLKGDLAETPYVKEKIKEIKSNIRAGQPVFLSGHLGGGKSHIAFQAARETYWGINEEQDTRVIPEDEDESVWDDTSEKREQEPFYVVSGDENVTRSDFFGRYVLKGAKQDSDVVNRIHKEAEEKFEKWTKENDQETVKEEGDRQWDLILAEVRNKLDTGNTTEFEYGPVYKALEEGKVLIIDEANAIPPETLISLNHVLSSARSTPGKNVIPLQHNGGKKVTVKPGFNIILTGNLNTQSASATYAGTQEMNPAFLSRFNVIDYTYVPQSTEGPLEEASEKDELFHILLTRVTDRRGNIRLPKGSVEKIWDLAKMAHILQRNFSGEEEIEYDGVPYRLEKNVPSIRALMRVFESWERDAYRHTLDYHLKKSFLDSITDETPDGKFIEQQLSDFGGFSFEEGYDEIVDVDDTEFIYKEKVAEYAFGDAPEHAYSETETEEDPLEHITEVEAMIDTLGKELAEIGCSIEG